MNSETVTYREYDPSTALIEVGFGGLRNDLSKGLRRIEQRIGIERPAQIGTLVITIGSDALMRQEKPVTIDSWSDSFQTKLNWAPTQSTDVLQRERLLGRR